MKLPFLVLSAVIVVVSPLLQPQRPSLPCQRRLRLQHCPNRVAGRLPHTSWCLYNDDPSEDRRTPGGAESDAYADSLSSLISSAFSDPRAAGKGKGKGRKSAKPPAEPFSSVLSILGKGQEHGQESGPFNATQIPSNPSGTEGIRSEEDELDELYSLEGSAEGGGFLKGLDGWQQQQKQAQQQLEEDLRVNDWTLGGGGGGDEPTSIQGQQGQQGQQEQPEEDGTESQKPSSQSARTPPAKACPGCGSQLTMADELYMSKFSVCQICHSKRFIMKFGQVNAKGEDEWDRKRRMLGGDFGGGSRRARGSASVSNARSGFGARQNNGGAVGSSSSSKRNSNRNVKSDRNRVNYSNRNNGANSLRKGGVGVAVAGGKNGGGGVEFSDEEEAEEEVRRTSNLALFFESFTSALTAASKSFRSLLSFFLTHNTRVASLSK